MRTTIAGLGLAALVTGIGAVVPLASSAAPAAPPSGKAAMLANEPRPAAPSDALPNPVADKQAELRQQAVADVLSGEKQVETINGSQVVKVGEEPAPTSSAARGQAAPVQDQYVELENTRTDRVFVLLVEFGNKRHPDFPDQDVDPTTPGPVKYDGPAFNEIPKPAANDNSTGWEKKYSPAYYNNLYFGDKKRTESLKTYYQTQSSGRYSVSGKVTAFTKVPFNEARYGRPFNGVVDGASCTLSDIVCSNTWALLQDGLKQWVADQRAAGISNAQIKRELATYDQVDRYDFDGDGDFNEPDGYLDRFQVLHAGGDQADGDPIYGEDAIWSHRWYARYADEGVTGPANNKLGGIQIGKTGIWAGDYTMQPENGGLSVVAHEYGHDLGLPDQYDTSASGDNPVSWWTLMAQSRVSAPGDQGLGTRAADLGAWEKLQLDWLDYETVVANQDTTLELGPHEYNTDKPQGVAVVLPDKTTSFALPTPAEGTKQWWSGAGDDYDASMTRTDIAVPAAGATLNLSVAYNIEEDFDYGYLEVQSPAGTGTWTQLPTAAIDPDTGGAVDGIDGVRTTYEPASYDLGAYAGQTIGFRARYNTDGAVQGQDPALGWSGLLVDKISVTSGGATLLADGAENPPNGWALDGFTSVGATVTSATDQFYLASNRTYTAYDKYLQTGPYNFGDPSRPDFAEKFPYQNGLLVNYWDTSYTNNNTSEHPGSGLILPVDANPEVKYNLQGQPWRGRIQNYDAPFGLERSDSFNLTADGRTSYVRGANANPVFDDTDVNRYFTPFAAAGLERVGVKVAGAGVQMRVLSQNGTTMRVRIN